MILHPVRVMAQIRSRINSKPGAPVLARFQGCTGHPGLRVDPVSESSRARFSFVVPAREAQTRMSDCGVCIGGWDADGSPEFQNVAWPRARKTHRCGECRREILKGVQYERISGKYDGALYCEKTCSDCAEIRSAFVCDDGEGPAFGNLWSELQDCFRDISTTCLDRLETTSAKKYLRERWMKWKGLTA